MPPGAEASPAWWGAVAAGSLLLLLLGRWTAHVSAPPASQSIWQRSSALHRNVMEAGSVHAARQHAWTGQGGELTPPAIAPAAAAAVEAGAWPLVYIYPLPDLFRNCSQGWADGSIYGAEQIVPRVLRGSPHVTSNPAQADLFLVDVWLYCRESRDRPDAVQQGMDTPQAAARAALHHIRTTAPWWERRNGTDHMWIWTQDHGYCGFAGDEDMVGEIQQSIMLTQWGLTTHERYCPLYDRVRGFGCEHDKVLGHTSAAAAGAEAHARLFTQTHLPCFVPGKDVVIASNAAEEANPWVAQHDPSSQERPLRLFFAGGVREQDTSYSHGVRATVWQMWRNETGFLIINRDVEGMDDAYEQHLLNSTFCLATTGAGWGVRLKLAIMHGCIPVVVAEQVQMPFEDVLPFEDFALRIPQHALYALPRLLQEVMDEPGRVLSMQQRLACAWQYFSWHPDRRALESLLCSLRRKLAPVGAVLPRLDWPTCQLQCSHIAGTPRQQKEIMLSPITYTDTGD